MKRSCCFLRCVLNTAAAAARLDLTNGPVAACFRDSEMLTETSESQVTAADRDLQLVRHIQTVLGHNIAAQRPDHI